MSDQPAPEATDSESTEATEPEPAEPEATEPQGTEPTEPETDQHSSTVTTSVERVDETRVKLWATVAAERVNKAIETAARNLAANAKIPGFRPGKAPRKVLESRLGKGAVAQEALEHNLGELYQEAVNDAGLEPVGEPEFDIDTFEEGKDAVFSATVEVRPEVTLPDYTEMRVPHPEWEVTDDELGSELDRMRERFAELETVERPIQAGDHVVVTVTARQGEEVVDDASADDLMYEVEDPEQSDEELDRNLVGAEPGAIVSFTDTLGEGYGERAGEELDFTAIVKDVKAKHLPALDDEFALTASEFDTIDELRTDLTTTLARQKRSYARSSLRGRVVEEVSSQVEVTLPQALIDQELSFRVERARSEANEHDLSLEDYFAAAGMSEDEAMGHLRQQAQETAKAQMVVDQIGREAGVEITQEDLHHEISEQAERLGRSPEEIAQFMSQSDRLQALASDVFRRKSIDYLVGQVEILSAPPDDDADLDAAEAEDETAGEGDEAPVAEGDADEPASGNHQA
jgi:trigger factor